MATCQDRGIVHMKDIFPDKKPGRFSKNYDLSPTSKSYPAKTDGVKASSPSGVASKLSQDSAFRQSLSQLVVQRQDTGATTQQQQNGLSKSGSVVNSTQSTLPVKQPASVTVFPVTPPPPPPPPLPPLGTPPPISPPTPPPPPATTSPYTGEPRLPQPPSSPLLYKTTLPSPINSPSIDDDIPDFPPPPPPSLPSQDIITTPTSPLPPPPSPHTLSKSTAQPMTEPTADTLDLPDRPTATKDKNKDIETESSLLSNGTSGYHSDKPDFTEEECTLSFQEDSSEDSDSTPRGRNKTNTLYQEYTGEDFAQYLQDDTEDMVHTYTEKRYRKRVQGENTLKKGGLKDRISKVFTLSRGSNRPKDDRMGCSIHNFSYADSKIYDTATSDSLGDTRSDIGGTGGNKSWWGTDTLSARTRKTQSDIGIGNKRCTSEPNLVNNTPDKKSKSKKLGLWKMLTLSKNKKRQPSYEDIRL